MRRGGRPASRSPRPALAGYSSSGTEAASGGPPNGRAHDQAMLSRIRPQWAGEGQPSVWATAQAGDRQRAPREARVAPGSHQLGHDGAWAANLRDTLRMTCARGECSGQWGRAPQRTGGHTWKEEEQSWGAASPPGPGRGLRRVQKGCRGRRGCSSTQNAERASQGKLRSRKGGAPAKVRAGHRARRGPWFRGGIGRQLEATASLPLLFLLENSILCFVLNLLAKEMLFSQNGHI